MRTATTIEVRGFKWPHRATGVALLTLLGEDSFGRWLGVARGAPWRANRSVRPPVFVRSAWPAAHRMMEKPARSAWSILVDMAATDNPSEPQALVGLWFETLHATLFRYLQRLTGDEQLAADLLQETFLRAVQAVRRNDVPLHPSAWLHRVATNLAYNALQRAGRRGVRFTGAEHSSGFEQGVLTAHAVRRALAQLSRPEVEALVLYEWAGLSCAEIAVLNNERPAAVRMRLSRARARFSTAYEREVRRDV